MQLVFEKALRLAMQTLQDHGDLVGWDNVDESTFRAFLLTAIKRLEPQAACQTEWNRFDLLVQVAPYTALVELKFYCARRTRLLDGGWGEWKGDAGRKNESEFRACVEKLRQCNLSGITHRFLVLVYRRGLPKPKCKSSYEQSYAELGRFGLDNVTVIDHPAADAIACSLIGVT